MDGPAASPGSACSVCAPGRLEPALCPQNTPFLWTKATLYLLAIGI